MLDVSLDATYIQGVILANRQEVTAMDMVLQALAMSSVAFAMMLLLAWLAYAEREGQ